MERDGDPNRIQMPEVPLVPAASVGYLLYPWAVQLVLANPPANDTPPKPEPG